MGEPASSEEGRGQRKGGKNHVKTRQHEVHGPAAVERKNPCMMAVARRMTISAGARCLDRAISKDDL